MGSLEEMEIKLDGIGHVLSDNYLSVPKYQRSYAWEEKHITDLYKDIATAINERENEYFLGSIVGSCTLCVVAEGALCGRIEASKIPLLPIESYDHVTNNLVFSAC
jgi:hypothetical protein